MRVHQQWLRVGVRDDSYALLAEEAWQLLLKLSAEIRALQIVYGTAETSGLLAVSSHTATLSSEV